MLELFAETSTWETVKTENWTVSGGESLGLGCVWGGEAKIMCFTHGDLKKSKGFLMVSASVGLRFELEPPHFLSLGLAEDGLVRKTLNYGGHAKKVTDGFNSNPFNYSPPAKVRVKKPFCLKDLEFAKAVSVSLGATAGVDGGLALFSFHGRDGAQLFTMDDLTLQAVVGIGINMGAIQGSVLVNLRPTPLSAAQQAEAKQIRQSTPWNYSASRRPAGGW